MPEETRSARDSISEKARRRVLTPECPFCGHDAWATGEDIAVVNFAGDAGLGGSKGWLFEVLPFACEGCGFVRFHAAQVLRKY